MRQILAVTWMNLCNLPQRFQSSSVVIIGICGVVAVLLSVLALATGFRRTIDGSASPDRAIVLSRGAESEGASSLTRIATATIANAPGIHRTEAGGLASAEILLIAPVARKSDGSDAYVTLRGVGRAGAVVTSVFAESVLLATIGAVAGIVIALFAFDGKAVNSIGSQSQPAQLVYQLSVSNESIAFAVALAVLIGVLGALLPAIRAATMPIASALRDS